MENAESFSAAKSISYAIHNVYGTHVPVEEPSTASKADITERRLRVRFVPISLQKSGTTGHRGWRELLELAACYPLPNKGMF